MCMGWDFRILLSMCKEGGLYITHPPALGSVGSYPRVIADKQESC